jgi:hypothetical protein
LKTVTDTCNLPALVDYNRLTLTVVISSLLAKCPNLSLLFVIAGKLAVVARKAGRERKGKAMSKDIKTYATREITPTMKAFHEWLEHETGMKLDLRSVALAGSLRMDFQKSDFWKQHESNYLANVEARREQKAKDALAKAEAAEKRAAERVAKAKAKAEAALAAANAAAEAANTTNATNTKGKTTSKTPAKAAA